MLNALKNPSIWREFQTYKLAGGHMSRTDAEALEKLIQTQAYLPQVEAILLGQTLAPPRKAEISKLHSDKKRIVYTYGEIENWILKLLTYLLQRAFDHLFAENLYSFRPHKGVHEAIGTISRQKNIQKLWCYKADISNYFNSVPIEQMLPLLHEALRAQPQTYEFLRSLLENPLVEENGRLIEEVKGIMAGTPISSFLANVYLAHIDHAFAEQGILYARYSDDIIIFCQTKEALDQAVAQLHAQLALSGLRINPDKQAYAAPGEKWTFLGISYHNGVIDVAPASLEKLKAKMRRKTRALVRWQAKKGASGTQVARVFVRVFHRKLFENTAQHELTWTRWYFPIINTTVSLEQLDSYRLSCIRYLATGKRNKSAYQFRYEDIKALGYVSLVHRYYKPSP